MPARRHTDVAPSQVERESRKAETEHAHEHEHPHKHPHDDPSPEPAQPTGPVNPPEPDEPMPQPEPPATAVNPPEPESDQQGVDNRTRDGMQVPVNP